MLEASNRVQKIFHQLINLIQCPAQFKRDFELENTAINREKLLSTQHSNVLGRRFQN
jgi:hypothetical protein